MNPQSIITIRLIDLEEALLNAALGADTSAPLRHRMAFAQVFTDVAMRAVETRVLGVQETPADASPMVNIALPPAPQPPAAPYLGVAAGAVPATKPRKRRTKAELAAAGVPSKPRSRQAPPAGAAAQAAQTAALFPPLPEPQTPVTTPPQTTLPPLAPDPTRPPGFAPTAQPSASVPVPPIFANNPPQPGPSQFTTAPPPMLPQGPGHQFGS